MGKEDRGIKSLINVRDKLVKLRSSLKKKIEKILNEKGIESKKGMFSREKA
jgi:transposase